MDGRRVVISVSVSPRNPDAATVTAALAKRGILLTHGGGQILAWAAAYLSGATNAPALDAGDPGLSDEELSERLDAF